MKVDLHIHTTYSDGVFSPEKIVDTAIEAGLNAIAITDHDNVLAYPIAVNYAQKLAKDTNSKAIEVLPGVEINTIYKDVEIHILGYFMNRDDADFQSMLKSQQKWLAVDAEPPLPMIKMFASFSLASESI